MLIFVSYTICISLMILLQVRAYYFADFYVKLT